jgi:hypothetical protein
MIFVLNYHKKSNKNIITDKLILYSSFLQRFSYSYSIEDILENNILDFEDNGITYSENPYRNIFRYNRTWDQVYNHIRFYYIDGTNIKFIDYIKEHMPEALI